jgi:gamma-tubulin complex component 2
MQTCTVFATYTNWLSRELEKSDPDLSGTTKPPLMTDDQWKHFQAMKTQRQPPSSSTTTGAHNESTASHSTEAAAGGTTKDFAELFDIMKKWESNFSRHLQILLDALNHYAATETVVLLSLCARLSTANQGTEYAGPKTEDDGVGG